MSNENIDDIDPLETDEWMDAIAAVIEQDGTERAHFLIEKIIEKTRRSGGHLPFKATTAYINTIPPWQEPEMPGNVALERRIRAIIRWNALAIVLRASKKQLDLGGHISSFSSSATILDTGFNHFFRGPDSDGGPDLIYFQGHVSPGIYARSFLEGRLTAEQLDRFRQETQGNGLSSYPHPRLMPDYWQFPTVSMGLGPIAAIYQARFLQYLTDRGIRDCSKQRVYAIVGDGEVDEPETLGAIGLAAREGLDNLTFIVNCNLQRLDGPVRGNGKIIQELEGQFRGAGWSVIKVIWGRYWDPLLAQDKSGKLLKLMEETVDGQYQNYKSQDGAYVREHFFNRYPETKAMVANMSDDDVWRLNRGGHDPFKMYAAFKRATENKGRPTVILAKTVKGYGMGLAGEGQNIAHQVKKMNLESVRHFRDRFNIPVPDEQLDEMPYYYPGEDSEEVQYLKQCRQSLGGYLPQRRSKTSEILETPPLDTLGQLIEGTGEREISSTMAFVRILTALLKDKKIGERIVPIVPDEARTFGMEGLFRQVGIYAHEGQKYVPQDRHQVAYYREDIKGQVLQEGINELGAMSSWLAAATSYSNNDLPMIPFYIFYSMFGFQRVGDMAWAAGDQRARGFLIGGTAGRTTLNGEGLQHQDGHSHMLANTIPSCISYDPTYAFELAVIIQDGLRRMYQEQEDIYYYITCMNENYQHPAMPEGAEEGIRRGLYQLAAVGNSAHPSVQLLGSGTILLQVQAAAHILARDFQVHCDVYSATSFNELARDGRAVERWNSLHPADPPKVPYVTSVLKEDTPTVVATDYIKAYPDQIRPFVTGPYRVLGTDGFGRSDSRANLRRHFEVDPPAIVLAALVALQQQGAIAAETVAKAMEQLSIAVDQQDPHWA
ncbi:MAG: pyruvate dehydrogenase (acetyl-transferring), homodimeric type [Myxococcota bacterium]|nr:pyruvate dehydrogenase (acetyl-transferring), homodimeric type [Myxococcota bacterium]